MDHRSPVHNWCSLDLQPITDLLQARVRWTPDVRLPRLAGIATAPLAYRAAVAGTALRAGLPAAIGIPRRVVRVDPDHVADDRGRSPSAAIGVPLRRAWLAAIRRSIYASRPLDAAQTMPPIAPALHGAAVRHRRARRGDRHRDLRPRPSGAPHVARHPLGVGRAHRGRRGARRDQPPSPQQGAVAGGPPSHPPRRQPGHHDGLRRGRHRRARRLAGLGGPCSSPREGQRRSGPGRPRHRARRRHPRPISTAGPARPRLRSPADGQRRDRPRIHVAVVGSPRMPSASSGWTYSLRVRVNSLVDWLQATSATACRYRRPRRWKLPVLRDAALSPTDTPWWIVTAAIGTPA